MQAYETLVIVVSKALGGETKTDEGPKSADDLERRLAGVFGG